MPTDDDPYTYLVDCELTARVTCDCEWPHLGFRLEIGDKVRGRTATWSRGPALRANEICFRFEVSNRKLALAPREYELVSPLEALAECAEEGEHA